MVLKLPDAVIRADTALQQQAFNFELQSPHTYDLKVLQKWLKRPKMGEQFLVGLDRNAWDEKDDLISLGLTSNDDPLAKWVTDKVMVWVHCCIGRRINMNSLVHYSEDWALRFLSLISTVLASVLPIVAIVVLYVVQSTHVRLGGLAAFTAVFAFILSVVTNAKRSDVFAATAAYVNFQKVTLVCKAC